MRFPWGTVISKFVIDLDGEQMNVTKYHPWIYERSVSTGVPHPTAIQYHCDELSESNESLDYLAIAWIAKRRLGMNQRALVAGICRALRI